MTTQNRWLIAAAGVLMQVAFGAVYAWSVFRIPLSQARGWSIAEVTAAFEIAVFVVGLAAFAGGLWMKRSGPRPVALVSAVLYGLGTALTGSAHSLTALYLTYGVIGGVGLGLGYIVPIAALVKWFPDKRGMITGLAVAGFGAGALVTAPVANSLIASVGVGRTFEVLGLTYLVVVFACALVMRNPPEGYAPVGFRATGLHPGSSASQDFTLRQALGTWQWYALWLTLFLNTTAGIAIISQASPMAQEISGVSAATAAGMVGLISIANGSGRLLWAWFSDAVGRRTVFLTMLLLQSAAFLLLSQVHHFGLLSLLAFLILLCYGGGFGTMPAFATDYFGSGQIGSIYGLMLTAWGCAAVFGPSLVAEIRQATGHYQGAMRWLALATLLSAVVPLLLRPPRARHSLSPVRLLALVPASGHKWVRIRVGFLFDRPVQALEVLRAYMAKLLCVAMLVGIQSVSLPGQSRHVSEPAVNLGDTSFLDGPAGPGFVVEQIGDAAHDGRITDSAGNALPGAGAVNSISGLTHIAWLSHKQVLGAWYGVEVVVSAAHVNAGAQGAAGGLGSTTVSPFILQWRKYRVWGMAIDQRVAADFDVPTGQYSRTSNVNIGSSTFTVHPYYAITVFPAKRLETSWRVHYLWNSTNNNPPIGTGAQSTQAGQAIHFNATAAYKLWKGLWVGSNGYYLKQITDGRIDAVALHNSPEQVGAIGPGMVWNSGSWFFYANGYQEFGAQNRATGHKLVLRVEKVFQ